MIKDNIFWLKDVYWGSFKKILRKKMTFDFGKNPISYSFEFTFFNTVSF